MQQQLDAVKARVESLQAQLVILQTALEEVAASGALGTPAPTEGSPEDLAAAAALEAQRLRGHVAQLEAQCRLRDVEAGQLRASLQQVQRRHDDAMLQAARAQQCQQRGVQEQRVVTATTDALDSTTEELQLLRDEMQVLKRQLAQRGRRRLARCDSDASDAASSSSSARVHRGIPGVSSAFAHKPSIERASTGSTTTEEGATGGVSPADASEDVVSETCPAEDAEVGSNGAQDGTKWPALRRAASVPKEEQPKMTVPAVRLRATACPAHSAPAAMDPCTPIPSAEPSVGSVPERGASRPPLARSSSGGAELPERSMSVRTSLQTWEALAALSAQGNKGLVVPSPRKLYWAGYKGVRLHDDA